MVEPSSSLGGSSASAEELGREKSTNSRECKSEYPRWHSAAAGATAGAAARVVTAPLDLLRIRRQLAFPGRSKSESIVSSLIRISKSEGGIPSLFRGNVAATYLWIGYSAVQFSLYTSTRNYLTMADSHNMAAIQTLGSNDMVVSFVSGATAGVCATMATYPFDICRTVFAAQGLRTGSSFRPPRSMFEFAQTMHRTQGFQGFFAGSTPAVIQIVPYMGLNFLIHDHLMKKWQKNSFDSSGLAGIISGGVSKLVVYPLDTAKKRLQAQAALVSGTTYKGTWDCLITMVREESVKSLYNGLTPSVLKNMLGTGLSFACFTFTKDVLEAMHDR